MPTDWDEPLDRVLGRQSAKALVTGLDIDAFSRERMTLTLNELNEEREGVKHLLG